MMVISGLAMAFGLLNILLQILGTSMSMYSGPSSGQTEALMSGTLGVIIQVVMLLFPGFVFFGALKMKKLESHGLAMAASILVMTPCIGSCCLLGLPIGIWSLVVLAKPHVKAAFPA
jgi:hypothetical protein